MTETIGQQLKQAREAHHLTIEKVAQTTRIRSSYLEAVEAEDFDSLPSPVQARAFLRLYADFLGVSLGDFVERQWPATGQAQDASPSPDLAPEQENEERSLPASKSEHAAPLDEFPPSDETEEAVSAEAGSAPEEETPTRKPSSAQTIFTDIGITLRQRRERLSLSLDEIERHTRVRKHYLLALEAGDFSSLPSPVQARGMLSNYARFLDLDVDVLLLRFADALQAQHQERRPELIGKANGWAGKRTPRLRMPQFFQRYLSADILVGGGLIILLVIFAIWGTNQVIEACSRSTPVSTAPSISDMLRETPTGNVTTSLPTIGSKPTMLLQAANVTITVTIPPGGGSPVQVVVIALDSALVYVTVDGKVQFEGRIVAGMVYSYSGNTQIEVRTGNGAAVNLIYNQNNLGAMGTYGEVVDRIYTANSILNPTPTNTPSPTITPIPSITPRPSATLRPSATPRYFPTPTQ